MWPVELQCSDRLAIHGTTHPHHSPLNDDGSPGNPLPITSEKDIFDYLDEPYVAPEDR